MVELFINGGSFMWPILAIFIVGLILYYMLSEKKITSTRAIIITIISSLIMFQSVLFLNSFFLFLLDLNFFHLVLLIMIMKVKYIRY